MQIKKTIKTGITGMNSLSGNKGVAALAVSRLYILHKIAKEKNLIIELFIVNHNDENLLIKVGYERIKSSSILLILSIIYLNIF